MSSTSSFFRIVHELLTGHSYFSSENKNIYTLKEQREDLTYVFICTLSNNDYTWSLQTCDSQDRFDFVEKKKMPAWTQEVLSIINEKNEKINRLPNLLKG